MLPEFVLGASGALALYHHLAYPVLLRYLARTGRGEGNAMPPARSPTMTVIVPAYNEAEVIAGKIQNLAALCYPDGRLEIVIACDGCTDATVAIARREIARCGQAKRFRLVAHALNRGKVAVLNEAIAASTSDVVVLTDASAMLASDALHCIAQHFADARVGVVCATYGLQCPGSEGERAYWRYQVAIKAAEAAVGAPMGAHGACYAIRRRSARPLEADTINDDFILPMRIVADGYRAVYDRTIVATELETIRPAAEFRRRVRIGAGNMQQALRLWRLADPRRPGIAFAFVSGKAMRAFMPFILLVGLGALVHLALEGSHMYQSLLASTVLLFALAGLAIALRSAALPRPVAWLGYLAEGHAASFVGALRYLTGLERRPWTRAVEGPEGGRASARAFYVPRSVEISKRTMDIVCGLGALAVMIVLFVPIALAIKLTSRGPIFYRQLRVGRQTPHATHLFWLLKFRTMYVDAEQRSGAVWASKNDPRITPVGRFLRKTRLDELPQCFNVLAGEMSVIGPRPERPMFFAKLESAIPFYTERTFGLKPGITGLAQVNQAYDQSIEDVRNKVLYDHAYAARITSWWEWLRTDIGIIFSTVQVMALGKGQ
ncbi:MAG: sugar transferase [Hyphomicrobiaceae bacterium]